ncbi:MAG: hypothetical protein K2I42_05910 [Anaeroplasmataceae bacterium]|nr:hypothetical protein [Anaeroplasmataceae bacterium]
MKPRWISFLLVFLMFGAFFLSVITKNAIFIYILFGFFFLLSILCIPLYFKRFKREYQQQENKSNDEVIEEINHQNGYNQLEHEVQQVRMVTQTWKNSSSSDKIKGTLFLLFFLGCIFGFVVCMFLKQTILGFIFFGLGFAEIIIALIVVKLAERISLRPNKKRNYIKATATVLATGLSSQSTSGEYHKSIYNTTYKVFLRINNQKRVAYSKEYYEVGDKVIVQIDSKNPKRIHILSKKEDIFDFDEDKY